MSVLNWIGFCTTPPGPCTEPGIAPCYLVWYSTMLPPGGVYTESGIVLHAHWSRYSTTILAHDGCTQPGTGPHTWAGALLGGRIENYKAKLQEHFQRLRHRAPILNWRFSCTRIGGIQDHSPPLPNPTYNVVFMFLQLESWRQWMEMVYCIQR